MRKIKILFLTFILCLMNIVPVFASYDRDAASKYGQKYAEDSNSTYYEFDSDCTNFVSQCEAVGGVVSYMPSSFPSAPSIFSKLKVDSSSNLWYMVHRTRTIGYNYYIYTKTWSCVSDFRSYFAKSSNTGSNSIATVYKYNLSSWSTVKNNLKVGDVVQYDNDDHAHSIIITYKSGSTVKYCAHSSNRLNQNISTFYNYMTQNDITYFYVIKYK